MKPEHYRLIYFGLPVLLTLVAGAIKLFAPKEMKHIEWKEIIFAPTLYTILLALCIAWISTVVMVVIELLEFVF